MELGFNTHIRAHFGEELSSDVSDGIVANGGHGTLGAAEDMADAEGLATQAVWASLAGVHPNLRHRASLKACLCRLKPYLARGMAVSQEDAPFSLAMLIYSTTCRRCEM